MEDKILKDDLRDGVIDDFIVSKTKKGRYWLITWYNKNITQVVLEKAIKDLSEHDTIKTHLGSIVGQIEVGEVSKEKHIHLSVSFTDSDFRGLGSFEKVLGEDIYVNSRPVSYNSYASKDITRVEDTEPVFYKIKKKDIPKYERIEESESDEEEKNNIKLLEEDVKKANKTLVKVDSRLVEVEKLKGIIDQQQISINKILKYREEDIARIGVLEKVVEGIVEERKKDKKKIDSLNKEVKEKSKVIEEMFTDVGQIRHKLKIKKAVKKREDSSSEEEKGKKKP